MSAYFITGTDTDAGKTLIASGLLTLARRQGLTTQGLKPVASGCESTPAGLRNRDALALQAASSPPLPYDEINPFAFAPAIAPHLAAQQAGTTLSLAALAERLTPRLAEARDLTLIEGAGGWRVPLNADEDLAGLATLLRLPAILVVGVRLGAINHARLTLEAIRRDGVQVAGWVANRVDPGMDAAEDNLSSLTQQLDAPCLGRVPYLARPTPSQVADHVQLPE
ncbi:dethiobiotin synthase [Franzmannia pantelleriensis]|uniref:ATP-dependent dethiobiotin synthetase BioD n=1 Tax=Franzmannia pantelleriensis TaxID=48727 RepID=A0A1G9VMB4_9GAMM|nr:dethiobiotin synthase [Halomonas pantelleriensis]SDM73334.1 dethiobiotin synthase [Halomonas pantelleriensis]